MIAARDLVKLRGLLRVEVLEGTGQNGSTRGPLRLRYVIARQVQIGDVKFEITPPAGTPIPERSSLISRPRCWAPSGPPGAL